MKHSLLLLLAFAMPSLALATPALVDARWLAQNLENDQVLIVDLRPRNVYEYGHIKNSTNTDVNLWRMPGKKKLQSMLPQKSHLQKLMSQIGATPEHHIVLVAGDSAGELATATRVYWTMDQLGHEKKSILDGSIMEYARLRLPVERGANDRPATDYRITNLKTDQITGDDINANKNLNIIDARSKAEFLGIYQGAPDERAGTIPGAQSLPYDWFTINGRGTFNSKENLETLMQTVSLDDKKPTVVFCHTGMRASLSWFVLHEILGNKDTVLYDASTLEWAKRKDLPMHQAVGIKH